MTPWMIEQAVPEDAAAIARLHAESFKVAYLRPGDDEHNAKVIAEATAFTTAERIETRMQLLLQSMTNPENNFYQIAMNDDGEPIGLIAGFKDAAVQEIDALYVDERYFGAGVGQALVEAYLEWADPSRPVELGVVKDNARAQKFYSKMGFTAMGDDRASFYDFLPETTMRRAEDR